MNLMTTFLKKIFVMLAVLAAISFSFYSSINAQEAPVGGNPTGGGSIEYYLSKIMEYTYGTLTRVDNLPVQIKNVSDLALSWLEADTTDSTATLQGSFANYANTIVAGDTTLRTLQPRLLQDLFLNAGPNTLPNANDLVYQVLLRMPYYAQDPRTKKNPNQPINSPYEYIKNAAAINIFHPIPLPNWRGRPDDKRRYTNHYNTMMAVESFNGYILSGLYIDYITQGNLSKLQKDLIREASSSNWFTQIASDHLGVVFRKILLFQSQTFLLLTQLLQTQKDLLTAQVLNNSLLVLQNQSYEQTLVQRATGLPPTL